MGIYPAEHTVCVNGVCLHYADVGSGRPVVLVHGNGESHDLFDVEIAQLAAAGYRVLAPDSRGHGANEPLDEYHYQDMAEDMARFIRALELDRPAYYGHSDGGIIGLLLELNYPNILRCMACSGANLRPEGIVPSFLEQFAAANERDPDPLVTLMLTEPDIDPEQLRRIEIPVLITAGEHDVIRPEETRCIAEHLPHARLVVVPDEDHGSYIENSEIMGSLLLDFLADTYRVDA